MEVSGKKVLDRNLLDSSIKCGNSKKINYNTEYKYYDFKIVFNDGTSKFWSKLNMSDTWRITIYYDPQDSLYHVRYN